MRAHQRSTNWVSVTGHRTICVRNIYSLTRNIKGENNEKRKSNFAFFVISSSSTSSFWVFTSELNAADNTISSDNLEKLL